MTINSRLDEIADDPALESFRAPLMELSAALNHSSKTRRQWAKIDLFSAFDPNRITIPPAESPRLRAVELAQRLLVFCPVLFTWLSLALAVEAYNAQLGANPDAASVPFLSLWQDGFDGRLNEFLRLGRVAFIDAILISLLLVATALAFFGHRRADRRAAAATQRIRTELCCVLTDASLILAAEPADYQESMTQHLEDAAERVQITSSALAAAAEHGAVVLGAIERAATALAAAEDRAATTFRPMSDAVSSLQVSTGSLSNCVSSLSVALAAAGDEHRQAAQQLAQTADDAVAASRTVVDGSQDLRDGVSILNERVSALLASLGHDFADFERSASSLSKAVAGLDRSAPDLAAATAALAAAANAIASEEVTDRLNRTVSTLEVGLREIRADLEALRPVINLTEPSL